MISCCALTPSTSNRACAGAAAPSRQHAHAHGRDRSPPLAHRKWIELFDECVKTDGWGQQIEAAELYRKLRRALELHPVEGPHAALLADTLLALRLRISAIEGLQGSPGLTLDDVRLLRPVIGALQTPGASALPTFPLDLTAHGGMRSSGGGAEHAQAQPSSGGHSQLAPSDIEPHGAAAAQPSAPERDRGEPAAPRKLVEHNGEPISVVVERAGFKDAGAFIDPFVVVSVYRADGTLDWVEPPRETARSSRREGQHILFNETVQLQTDLIGGFLAGERKSIIFEFKHFKPSKNKISTKCWTFIDVGTLAQDHDKREVAMQLEWYQKPTDYKRKRLRLLTVKPLFLHVAFVFQATKASAPGQH